ncbi:ABC transporter ATP-binding protein [Phaeovulum vinaykumarii]|nr:ABC transporter ATP-binding protein [Phaeovulum vinaykumarii]
MAYGDQVVLDGIDLDLPKGQVLALLGASGSGKTTLLRLVAGLLMPTAGTVEIAGQTVAAPERGVVLPPEKRGLGMVFQDYALWPHLSVARNVAFPLEMQRLPAAERAARVTQALARVGLGDLADRRPSELSGGQQQRVAIARAIVGAPPLVLFDEPLSNLDRELREGMVEDLAALVANLELSAVYVTHDHAEALALADRIAVIHRGGIAQLASPAELIDRPASAAVAEFLRLGTLLPARCSDGEWVIKGTDIALGPGPDAAAAQVLLPERSLAPGTHGPAQLRAEVRSMQVRNTGFALSLTIAGTDLPVRLLSAHPARPGEMLALSYSPDALRWFPQAG